MQAHLISVALVLTTILQTIQSDREYCEEPPVIPLATSDAEPSERYAINTVITYTCQFGYFIRGIIHTVECRKSDSQQNAEWTLPEFSCAPRSCGDPGFINNGRRTGFLFAFPNSVTYECNEGYKLEGLPTRYCQASGVWSGRLPECKDITCSPPQNLENGYATYSTLNFGSELQYKCNKGYLLNTKETVFCTSDGKWSNANVRCIEVECDMPQKPEYGSVLISDSSNVILAGSIALFSCDDGKIVDGPTTSKCLETGEWTFPPPRCLEPCQTPYVENGFIGFYEQRSHSRSRVFRQKKIGSEVKEYDVLYLRCSGGYEVLDSGKVEDAVTCKQGKWSQKLQCEPASCRNKPPFVQNAQAVDLNPEHGGNVLYQCDEDFTKIQNEEIVCDFGTWKGSRPVCKDTRCFLTDLEFPGLVKGRESFYRHGEFFGIQCDPRYQVSNASERELRCIEGTWKGPLPPCVAASCIEPPPKIDHGQPEIHSAFHTSAVKYTCENPYILTNNYEVQCLFGKWEGRLPKCEDSRCYLKNLQQLYYVDEVATDPVTLSGDSLNVICKEGYSASQHPICSNGKWRGSSGSLCKENDCTVPILYHGDIKEQKFSDYYWNWWKVRYERTMSYIKIPAGTTVPYSTSLFLSCHNSYSFQGTAETMKKVICTKGKWMPDPVCIRLGQPYRPPTTTRKPYRTTLSIKKEQSKTMATSKQALEFTVAATRETTLKEIYESVKPAVAEILTSTQELPEDEDYCEYPIKNDNLIAHVDGKKLRFQDKVKIGSVVVFRCKHVGYHHLNGTQHVKCENKRNWNSLEFPTCSDPIQGSAVILYDKSLNVSIEGYLEARKGQDVKLSCVAIERSFYPHWSYPTKNRVTITHERRERESRGDILYITYLNIENADIENEGQYGCAVESNNTNIVNLIVNDPNLRCPEFSNVVGIKVTYDFERRVKSRALFSCTKPHKEIHGKAVLTCKSNGEWSDVFPECTDIKCEEIKGNDLLTIYYVNDRNIGTKATFHCFLPARPSGASFATCLENGTWSDPPPTCTIPPCVIQNISSFLPENVILDADNINKTVPYNKTVKLTCSEDMIVVGDPFARCNRKSEWDIGNIQCISGCPALIKDPDSSLIITPNSDVYKLFNRVTFSCPPGMSLTTESQLIMCLKYGWSNTNLPDCQKIK